MKKVSDNIPPLRIPIRKCYDENDAASLKITRDSRIQESHPEREILLVVSGKSNFLLDGKFYPAVPGDVFFIDHWVPHQGDYGTIKNDFTHIWIHLQGKKLFSGLFLVRHHKDPPRPLIWRHSEHLLGLLNERWDRALLEPEHSVARQEIYRSIARILAEELTYLSPHEPDATRSKSPQIADWIKNYISIHYGRNASMPELEKLTGYNRFYLMRLFKAEYGMTIGAYINCVRRGFLVAAMGKGMRQKEIAQQLGFRSASAFWLWKSRDRERKDAGDPKR